MGKYVVVLGDATSHGDKVTSSSSSFDISGKNAALLNGGLMGMTSAPTDRNRTP
jgi:uncharacterized Zn-binding protein involved in type VI secretion